MYFELFHGDSVQDTNPWCPVCFDLSYDNLGAYDSKSLREGPRSVRKGVLYGFSLRWRARSDFEQCAEQKACVFCACLLQVINRFWKEPRPRMSVRGIRTYTLTVYQDGSVEMTDSAPVYPRAPLVLLLFTPSGINCAPNKPTVA